MNCPMQSGDATLAVLLEAQINRGKYTVDIGDAVDSEPAPLGIAAAPITRPIEATKHRIVKRIALEARVKTRLKLANRIHGFEATIPPCVSIYAD